MATMDSLEALLKAVALQNGESLDDMVELRSTVNAAHLEARQANDLSKNVYNLIETRANGLEVGGAAAAPNVSNLIAEAVNLNAAVVTRTSQVSRDVAVEVDSDFVMDDTWPLPGALAPRAQAKAARALSRNPS